MTPTRKPTDTSDVGEDADFGDDEPTVIDLSADFDAVTPVELPRCTECGNVVFFDDFTEPAAALAYGLFTSKQCLCSRTSVGAPGSWYWCSEKRKYVVYVP